MSNFSDEVPVRFTTRLRSVIHKAAVAACAAVLLQACATRAPTATAAPDDSCPTGQVRLTGVKAYALYVDPRGRDFDQYESKSTVVQNRCIEPAAPPSNNDACQSPNSCTLRREGVTYCYRPPC
jgi:hypothetical protein